MFAVVKIKLYANKIKSELADCQDTLQISSLCWEILSFVGRDRTKILLYCFLIL